jgi:D-sedoheptulose 7-phosphate isomerase
MVAGGRAMPYLPEGWLTQPPPPYLNKEVMIMSFPQSYKADVLQAIETIDLEKVNQAIEILAQARDQGRHIFVCGNGGSASTASHFVCDMVKGASFKRDKRFRIMALTDSLPTITAYSNDVSYECVFVEQLKNFAEPGDVLMAISGSGNSPNVLRAVEYANSIGCRTVALSGRNGGQLGPLAELNIQASNPHMGRIEDMHMIVMHMICYYFMDAEMPVLAETRAQ